jgi:hypothetical protein
MVVERQRLRQRHQVERFRGIERGRRELRLTLHADEWAPALGQEARMLKLLFAVAALIAAVMVAGLHYDFNPAIPIFVILGFGLYGVTRIGGPALPANAPVVWGGGHGIFMRGKDYVANNDDSCGGEDPREGDGFR